MDSTSESILRSQEVAVSSGHEEYALTPPYSPGADYPEYPFGMGARSGEGNPAYEGVRDTLRLLRMDEEHYGRRDWNPFGGLMRPGDSVVLKPNFVRDFRETEPGHGDCLITHGSVIRAVLDYVYIALDGKGRIIIADAPQNDADFEAIRRITGLDAIQEFYSRHAGFDVEVYDLRQERARKIDGVIVGHRELPGDPQGYVKVDLGEESAFAEITDRCHLLYGSEYDTAEIRAHHHDETHEYLISRTILAADCVISLPKVKTHKKTGITVNMKNLVGINGNKNWLPHHRQGTPAQGGDEFADDRMKRRIERKVVGCFKQVFPLLGPLRGAVAGTAKSLGKKLFGDTNNGTVRSGNWYGNDTTWRMVIDLNRIFLYADTEGRLHDRPVRRFFGVVDGIIAGEGNGPLDATPKSAGIVAAGTNPVAIDMACARLMGFDPQRLPVIRRAFDPHPRPLVDFDRDQITVCSNDTRFTGQLSEFRGAFLAFAPHFGWKGRVEIATKDSIAEVHLVG